MTKFTGLTLIMVSMLLSIGCAHREIYYWGNYQDIIYKSYSKPGEMPAKRQIEVLLADYERARSENKPMPPGWYAHLGVLYYETGQLDLAHKQLSEEKNQFPESKAFVDNLLKRLEAKK